MYLKLYGVANCLVPPCDWTIAEQKAVLGGRNWADIDPVEPCWKKWKSLWQWISKIRIIRIS